MKVARLWVLLGVMLAGSFPVLAQTAPNLANGMPPQGSYDGSSVDTVNLMNGNLTLHIPLPTDYPQRGKLGIKYYLVVNAKTWKAAVDITAGANQWNPTTICTISDSAPPTTGPCGQGPVFVSTASFGMTRTFGETFTDGSDPMIAVSRPNGLATWDGSTHGIGAGTDNGTGAGTYVAADTSGYRVIISGSDANGLAYNAVVIDRDGTQYSGAFQQDHGTCVTTTTFGWPSFPGSSRTVTCSEHFIVSSITDANGNVLTAPLGVPDIAVPKWNGPTIAAHEAVGSEANGCLSSFGTPWVAYLNYPAPNGVTDQIKLCFAVYPQLATSFSPAGIHQFQDDYSNHAFPGDFRQPFYLSSVILPDGTQWALNYDSYGEITSVTTPGGAELQYTWAEGQFPTTSSEDLTSVSRAVHTRTVTDANGHSSVWTYQWGTQAQDGTVTHTVTDPNNNDTVHVFQSIDLQPTTFPFNLKEITTLNYQGTGGTRTLAQRLDTTWLLSSATGGVTLPTDKKTTLFPSQKTSSQHTDYDPNIPTLGLAVSKKTYDWGTNGSGSPGALLREDDTVYQWQKDSRYLTANMIDLPASSVVISPIAGSNTKTSCPVDGAGTLKACMAETDYTYDETGYLTNYETAVGALPAGSHLAAPNPVRGNPTTVSKWLNTGSPVVSHTNWYDTGMAYIATDPGGHNTTHSYDLAYNGALPTKTCNAKSQCVSATYDLNTGLLTSFTDANGSYQASGTSQGDPAHTSNYSYDFIRRMTLAVSQADSQGQHPQTTFTYPNATTVQRLQAITSSLNDNSTSHGDGLAHVVRMEHLLPGGNSLVDTTFDGLGHTTSSTNPYYTSSDPTFGLIQTQYDALGRATTVTEQDGSVKSVDYSGGNCTVATDEAGNQRKSCSDGLGRLIEVDEPGAGSPGSPSSGIVTINGSLQTTSGPSAAIGSITIGGAEKSTQVLTHAATPATVTVTVGGADGTNTEVDTVCNVHGCHNITSHFADSGTMQFSVHVGGTIINSSAVNYNSGTSAVNLAASLAGALPANSLVTSTYGGSTSFTLTTTATAASANSSTLSASITTTCSSAGNTDTVSITCSQGWTLTPASQNFSGGSDNVYATVYDTGTITATVNGHSTQVSYGQNDSPTTIAANLLSAINSDTAAFVTATPDALVGKIDLRSKSTGTGANASLASSVTFDTGHFSGVGASFTAGTSGSTLTGGSSTGGDSITDSGTVTLSIGSFTASATYGPSPDNNTAALVASALNGTGPTGLNRAGSPVTASASNGVISISYATNGSAGNIAATVVGVSNDQGHFSSPSFSSPGTTLTGGIDPDGFGMSRPYVTLYAYDALGNLLNVTQKGDPTVNDSSRWRVRNFTYDSLSRLLTATNPESGTISYSYDADSNLLQKTSPAPNQTGSATQTVSYCYDELHRVKTRAYTAQSCPLSSPVVTYTYDGGLNGIGHLTYLADQAGTASYSYDPLGRLLTETRTLTGANNAAISKSMAYNYFLDGSLQALTYPSGATVTYAPWQNGSVAVSAQASAVDLGNGINYATGGVYGPDLSLTTFVSGSSGTFTGITNAFSYNKRLQPVNMSATAPSLTIFSIGYDFHVGNGVTGTDNGNVWSIYNFRDRTRDQAFTYDPLNRLASAQNAGTDCNATVLGGNKKFWGNTYTYDAWGNLLDKNKIGTACAGEGLSVLVNTNNRLASGYSYDSAGNMTFDATSGLNYNFDQENRLTGTGGYTYTYDGDGNRVRKSNGNLAANGTLYWAMSPGIVAETDLAGTTNSEYIFFDGKRVARRDGVNGAGGVFYYFSDHLKTASVIADSAGTIKNESDYYPWGGELQFTNNNTNHYRFTGKERDGETGLDYFGARYYSNGLGRFVTPDWAAKAVAVPYADPQDPQSLNLYSYVRNRPTAMTDPDGHNEKDDLPKLVKDETVTNKDGSTTHTQTFAGQPVSGTLVTGTDTKPATATPMSTVSTTTDANGKFISGYTQASTQITATNSDGTSTTATFKENPKPLEAAPGGGSTALAGKEIARLAGQAGLATTVAVLQLDTDYIGVKNAVGNFIMGFVTPGGPISESDRRHNSCDGVSSRFCNQ